MEEARTLRKMTSYADILSVATKSRCFGEEVAYTSRTLPRLRRVRAGKSVVVTASAIAVTRKDRRHWHIRCRKALKCEHCCLSNLSSSLNVECRPSINFENSKDRSSILDRYRELASFCKLYVH